MQTSPAEEVKQEVKQAVDPKLALLIEHAKYATMSKAERHKNIRDNFANEFLQ